MKVAKGAGVVTIAMRNEQDFIAAMKSPLCAEGNVYDVESAADWNALMKSLGHTTRPFAVCVLVPK